MMSREFSQFHGSSDLFRAHGEARDIEIAGAGLEGAFLELTGDGPGTAAEQAVA